MHPKLTAALTKIRDEINQEYGFYEGIPRINYGPCGVFAHIFFHTWNRLFRPPVHICFVMTPSRDECDHVCLVLPSGELYDGGIGLHTRQEYEPQFVVDDMVLYDEALLDKWSYGLNRTYPRFCPQFNCDRVTQIVASNLEGLLLRNQGSRDLTAWLQS